MASVEQREATHPAGLTSLELFDKFKSLEEDKDSDEESFHLPLLDSEEDISVNNKETSDHPIQNGESEEEIMNKFDCTNFPDQLDPKVEDIILSEEVEDEKFDSKQVPNKNKDKIDEIVENGLEEINKVDKTDSDIPEGDENLAIVEKIDKNTEKNTIEDKEGPVKVSEEVPSTNTKENENIIEKSGDVNEHRDTVMESEETIVEKIAYDEMAEDIVGHNEDDNQSEEKSESSNQNEETKDGEINEKMDEDKLHDHNEEHETVMETDSTDVDQEVKMESAKIGNKEENIELSIDDSGKTEKETKQGSELINTLEEIRDKSENSRLQEVSKEITNNYPVNTDVIAEETKVISIDNIKMSENNIVEEDKVKPEESIGDSSEMVVKEVEDTPTVGESDSKESDQSKSKTTTDASDPGNSENLEPDDLLDISVICDVDEDNAKAVAENANDGQTSEKSDNDEQDDKPENDIEESENDQEENLCSSDKDDAMEFEDGASNSNLQFEISTNDNVTLNNASEKLNSDSVDSSDSLRNKDVEMVDVLPKVIAGLAASNNDDKLVEKKQTEEVKTENNIGANVGSPEEPVEYLDLDKHMAEQKKALEVNAQQAGKRPLPFDDQDVAAKKIRLSDILPNDDSKKSVCDGKIKTLTSFESYMRHKVFNKKLTKSDLEQFCLQKICEVIMHKTELGDLHQTVRKQEQIIETLRKDLQQLTKQARDLDIVNKKLINELKGQNGKQKPLVPLKITRSVGLQVKLTVSNEQTRKRAPNTPNRPNVTNSTNTTPSNNRPRTVTPINNNVVKQVSSNAPSPRKSQPASGSTTPILSQALQTPNGRQSTTPVNTAKRTPIARPKTAAEPTKPANPGVIDLTDEDDRSSKPAGSTPVKILNKQVVTTPKLVPTKVVGKSPNNQNKVVSINQVKTGHVVSKGTPGTRTVTTLPQGVRLTPTGAVKNGIAIPANVVTSSTGGTQLMYVVQPTSSLVTTTAQGGQKAVLLNFQPTNGILSSALNGSAVSVIPTKTNVQVKTSSAPRKHPAPLPLPPPMQANNNLKPLLPKPHLSIRKTDTGIILQWRMPYNLELYEFIASYQLFAYQETNAPPSTDMWRKVGDVKALALPMACTLTQFADKNKYYFAVRSVDVHKRIGAFSDPEEISL